MKQGEEMQLRKEKVRVQRDRSVYEKQWEQGNNKSRGNSGPQARVDEGRLARAIEMFVEIKGDA